jgi:hypothetical protein
MIIIELLFMLVIYIPFYKGDFASYYFYKNYYLLWPLMFINLGGLLSLSDNQSYDFVKTNLIMMLLVFGLYKSGIENRLTDKNILLNPTSFSTSINDIYFFNDFIMNNREDILSRDEIIDLSEVKTKIPLEHTLYYEKDILRRLWYYNIMQNPHDPAKNYIASIYDEPEDLQTVLQRNSIEYVIIPKNNNQPTLDQPVEFENNSFAVYKINH